MSARVANAGSCRARNGLLEAYLHLFMLNRGVLLTPFHNMVLICPAVTEAEVDLHNQLLDDCLATLAG